MGGAYVGDRRDRASLLISSLVSLGLATVAGGGLAALIAAPVASMVICALLTFDYSGSIPIEGGSHFKEARWHISRSIPNVAKESIFVGKSAWKRALKNARTCARSRSLTATLYPMRRLRGPMSYRCCFLRRRARISNRTSYDPPLQAELAGPENCRCRDAGLGD